MGSAHVVALKVKWEVISDAPEGRWTTETPPQHRECSIPLQLPPEAYLSESRKELSQLS